jgi:hypothetical protein
MQTLAARYCGHDPHNLHDPEIAAARMRADAASPIEMGLGKVGLVLTFLEISIADRMDLGSHAARPWMTRVRARRRKSTQILLGTNHKDLPKKKNLRVCGRQLSMLIHLTAADS